MHHSTLRDPAPQKIKQIGHADLVIGLVTRNVRPEIAAKVAQQAIDGAKTYYPDLRTVLVNADTGLKATTRDALHSISSANIPVLSSRYDGVLGKGAATCAILHAALDLQAKAIVILDGSTDSATPSWIPALATFVLNGRADLVKPRYHWPLPDGALSDLLFYPFTRAIWGTSLRHPAADDYAISARLAEAVLTQDVWLTEVNRFGFDIWLSTFAITQKWRVAQSALGTKKQFSRAHTGRTQSIFKEAVGTMFRQLHLREKSWGNTSKIKSLPTLTEFAPPTDLTPVPQKSGANYIEALALGWMEHRALWKRILLPENLALIEYQAGQPVDQFYYPPELWAKVAFDHAVVYNKGERDPDAVASSLYPHFLGRLASFWSEVAGLTDIGRAGTVAAQAMDFEELIPYLKYRWDKYLPWIDSGEIR